MEAITNITGLRNNLLSNYEKLNNKELGIKESKEITSMAAKVMSTCKLEISYAKHQSKVAAIPFLETQVQ